MRSRASTATAAGLATSKRSCGSWWRLASMRHPASPGDV
jgi:hypothetical protein